MILWKGPGLKHPILYLAALPISLHLEDYLQITSWEDSHHQKEKQDKTPQTEWLLWGDQPTNIHELLISSFGSWTLLL
jgi:hypothetical protein